MSAKVAKEVKATGYAFFSLLNEDDVIEREDCRRFIPICDVADPDTMTDYLEVYPSKKEEEVEDCQLIPNSEWEFVDFSEQEIEYALYGGRVSVAMIDAQNGIITLEFSEEVIPSDFVIIDEDYSFATKVYPKKIRGTREYAFNPWNEPEEKKGWRKPRRNNRKTMPDRKIQRSNRALLGQVKIRCVEEEDFYDFATLLSYDELNSIFSEMEFYDEEFNEDICA
jgi:hypothetical protein